MNMLPDQNLSNHHLIYGSTYAGGGYYGCSEVPYYLVSDPMAEDESRTETNGSAASSSKNNVINGHDQEKDDQRWLQLSIGGSSHNINIIKEDDDEEERSRRSRGLIELDLLPPSTNSVFLAPRPILTTTLTTPNPYINTATSSMFFHQYPGNIISGFPHQDITSSWGFGTWPRNTLTMPSSPPSTSGTAPLLNPRPFQIHSGGVGGVSGSSGIDFRVIDPPRRPHSGLWFMLQAAQNQTKEPVLPQISKNFLRIKDGRITVRLVQKYLVNKLKLESESEIEIRCRGQQLEPLLTLEHIRDNIWRRNANLTLLPNSSTLDHIMVLHYARIP